MPIVVNQTRLTSVQKWDLMGMTVAALISVGLLSAPILMTRPAFSQRPAAVDAAAQAPVTVVTTLVEAKVTPARVPARRVTRVAQRARQRNQPIAIAQPIVTAQPVAIAKTVAAPPVSRKPLSRLARLVAGDGSYSVRPFPTVPTSEQR